MFSDIHINQVLLAELVDGANSGLATVSGDVRKRTFFDKSVKNVYIFECERLSFTQNIGNGLKEEFSWRRAVWPARSRGLTLASYRYFFLRVDDKMEAAS